MNKLLLSPAFVFSSVNEETHRYLLSQSCHNDQCPNILSESTDMPGTKKDAGRQLLIILVYTLYY